MRNVVHCPSHGPHAILRYADDFFWFTSDRDGSAYYARALQVVGEAHRLSMTKINPWSREPEIVGFKFLISRQLAQPKEKRLATLKAQLAELEASHWSLTMADLWTFVGRAALCVVG